MDRWRDKQAGEKHYAQRSEGGGGGVGKMSSDKRNNYMYVYLF